MEGYIYTITNIQTGKQYIGKTFNFEQRKLQHLSALRKNQHHSVELQRAYNKYGENSFLWNTKKIQIKTENDLNVIEMQEQLKIAVFKKYDLENIRSQRQRKGVKNSLTQDQVNYILANKDFKTRKQIGLDLNISADRVGAVILGKSYPDLVKNYYSSI